MNKEQLTSARRYFDRVHGVTMKAVRALDDADLEFRPSDAMRTVKALVFHLYALERGLAEAVQTGELAAGADAAYTPEKDTGAAALERLRTRDDLARFATECHEAANAALCEVGDAELSRTVRSPYGEFTGSQFVTFINDEHWHHRGQLFTYLRLLGKEPPNLYGYDD